MVIIQNISHDIKEKIHDADKDIRKAIDIKHEYPSLSYEYDEYGTIKYISTTLTTTSSATTK